MANDPIADLLTRQPALILDGGLATELEVRGHRLDARLWSAVLLSRDPEAIGRLHTDYLEAGADCVVSASYQATLEGFGVAGYGRERAERLLASSVEIALVARDRFWSGYRDKNRERPLVAASVGPYGAYLADGSEYTGDYDLDEAGLHAFHARRLHLLASAGPDLLACETIPSRAEARALARLLRETPGPPAWLSFSCRDDRRISDGTELARVLEELEPVERIVAVGVNCLAPELVAPLLRRAREATDRPLVAYPNSGELWDAQQKRWYSGDSSVEIAARSHEWLDAGARVLGGCCRTGPEDVRRLRSVTMPEPPP